MSGWDVIGRASTNGSRPGPCLTLSPTKVSSSTRPELIRCLRSSSASDHFRFHENDYRLYRYLASGAWRSWNAWDPIVIAVTDELGR